MNIFFLRIYDFFQRRRRLFLGLLFALICVLGLMVASLRYNEDIYDFLPLSDNQQKAITLYQDISGGKRIVAMFSMKDGSTDKPERLAEAVDTFALRLQEGDGRRHVKDVTTQVDFDKIAGVTEFVYHHLPMMLTDSDYVRMDSLLSQPDYVDERLAADVEMILMPATGIFSNNISYDPLSLFSPLLGRMQARRASMPFDVENGYIYTSDGRYAVALMTSAYGAMESAKNGQLVSYVDSICRQTMLAVPDVDVAVTGSPVIAVDNSSQIKTDSRWAMAISVSLILLLLLFSFRNVRNLLLIGVAIIFGWLFAMGLIAVVRSNVSLIVLGIGSVIVGIAVNYPLHFIAHTAHGGTTREVLKDMVAPLLIGNVTTVGAFASLVPLDAPALRDLGLFAAFMLMGTILFVLVILPHLVKRRELSTETGEKERLPFGRIATLAPNRHRWVLWVIMVLTIVLGYFSLGTSFDANMHHVNYLTPTQQRLMADLHVSAGVNDTTNVYVVTEAESWDKALCERERLGTMLDSLHMTGQVKSFSDVSSLVCSQKEQARRIGMWNAFWSAHRSDVLQQLRKKAAQHGFSSDAFAGFEEIVSAQYAPQPFEHFEPLASVLLTGSMSTSTGACSVVDIVDAGDSDVQQLEHTLNTAMGDKGYSFDFVGMNSAVAKALSDDFNYIGFACGLIVFLFLWLSFGRLELSLLAFLPMALGWIWILGTMDLLGMQFNIVNVILATFIFGQGDDYTIFMTDGLINEYAYKKKLLPSYKNSIIISALIMFIGMGSLIVAKHPALYSLAQVTIVGMLTVVLMAWVVPPMFFDWLVRSGGRIRRVPVTTEQVVRTVYCAAVYLFELAYGCIFGIVSRIIPLSRDRREVFMHSVVYKTMRMNINHICGVRSVISNPHGEDFSRGSVMICNHQSMLDPIYMLALSPKVKVMISGKVWRNPVVNPLFRLAGFLNLDRPVEELRDVIGNAVAKGYNVVIFPEGRRNDEEISRFHKGAFYIAGETGADILPVYIHGAGHVMPKGSGLASRGRIDVEIGKRVPASRLKEYGDSYQTIAQSFCHEYQDCYSRMKREIRTSHYFHDYIIYKYTYKGTSVERETRHMLKQNDDFSSIVDKRYEDRNAVSLLNAGKGQLSLLFALVHPECEVHSYAYDNDDVAMLVAMEPMPENLHVHHAEDEQAARIAAQGTTIITDWK